MSSADLPPDAFVRTALQLLPVPDHAEGFWDRVSGALSAHQAPVRAVPARSGRSVVPRADATSQGIVVFESIPLVPAAFRRPSNAVLAAVAAAAVVIVALAGTSLLNARTGTQKLSASGLAQPSRALDALVADAQAAPGTPTTLSSASEQASSAAVLTWVQDVHAGHGRSAWAAMATASQTHFGSVGAFAAQLSTLAQDYVAWPGASPDQIFVTPVATDSTGSMAVVTVVASVTVDGQLRRRAEAFPVRVSGGVARLEPFGTHAMAEMVVPAVNPADGTVGTVAPGDHLVIVVPDGVAAPVIRLDDGAPKVCGQAAGTKLILLAGTDGQRCSYQPADGMRRGEHTLTVAFVGADGSSISAAALLFEAA